MENLFGVMFFSAIVGLLTCGPFGQPATSTSRMSGLKEPVPSSAALSRGRFGVRRHPPSIAGICRPPSSSRNN